jgi:uncharacterized membrane protein
MTIKYPNIKISVNMLSKLRAAGLIDEVMLRNIYIKKEFVKRSGKPNKCSKNQTIKGIAAELFMAPKTVKAVIYRRKHRKKPFLTNIKELK